MKRLYPKICLLKISSLEHHPIIPKTVSKCVSPFQRVNKNFKSRFLKSHLSNQAMNHLNMAFF